MGDLPTGTLTFLFTDIEGSTRRWQQDRDAMSRALAAHDDVLGAAVAGRGGRIFKHTGDGMCAVFESAADAVGAAVGAQGLLELPVRMGVHAGEAELREGDYFGPALNRTARIMNAGHGGQVLVSGLVAALAKGFDLLDLGQHRLRDLTEPERIFQVKHGRDRDSYPPLRTLDASAGNLPSQSTRFIGREAQLADVRSRIAGSRLVTLTGVGGVGKSRLALQVAAEALPDHPDGAWLVELASLGDPDALGDVVAAVLGVTRQMELTASQSVVNALQQQKLLLVLDNCEHLLDAVANLVADIIERCPEVTILATSREALGLMGEQAWPVPSLSVVGDGPAVELFVDRAVGLDPLFELTESAKETVTEICERLDGVPLAIELAAARTRSMTPAEIKGHLDERFRLLTGGSRRGLERHQTLRHAVQWSYDLLNPSEQHALRHLSTFAGGFDLEAAQHVTSAASWTEALDLLESLVRKSLAWASGAGEATRYGLLETIRQFAEDELIACGEVVEARSSHAAYFAHRSTQVRAELNGSAHAAALIWCDRELANLRAAFRWSVDAGDLDTATQIATKAGMPGLLFILRYEVLDWAFELLEILDSEDRTRVLPVRGLAAECWRLGMLEEAQAHARAAIDDIDDPHLDIDEMVLTSLGSALNFEGRLEEAIAVAQRAKIRPGESQCGMCESMEVWATAAIGRHEVAQELAEDAVARAIRTENPAAIAFAHAAKARAYEEQHPKTAAAELRRAAEIAREAGDLFLEGIALRDLAANVVRGGSPTEALELFEQLLLRWHRAGDVLNQRTTYGYLLVLLHSIGHTEQAAILYGALSDDLATVTFTNAEADRLEQVVAQLSNDLADSFEIAVSRGRAMQQRELNDFALDTTRSALVRAQSIAAAAE